MLFFSVCVWARACACVRAVIFWVEKFTFYADKVWRAEEDCIHPANGVEKDPPASMKSKTGGPWSMLGNGHIYLLSWFKYGPRLN